jgi:PIN domain nuclease of toxin-antitoxin system
MQLLIDTHAILWYQTSDTRLSKAAKEAIANPLNQCFVSIGSLWEMAIKISLNKLSIEGGFKNFPQYLLNNQFDLLQINSIHLNQLLSCQ